MKVGSLDPEQNVVYADRVAISRKMNQTVVHALEVGARKLLLTEFLFCESKLYCNEQHMKSFCFYVQAVSAMKFQTCDNLDITMQAPLFVKNIHFLHVLFTFFTHFGCIF